MTKKPKPKGGSPSDDYTGKNKYDKDWPPKPKPIKQAKKNKNKKPHDPGADNPVKNPATGKYEWAGNPFDTDNNNPV